MRSVWVGGVLVDGWGSFWMGGGTGFWGSLWGHETLCTPMYKYKVYIFAAFSSCVVRILRLLMGCLSVFRKVHCVFMCD